MAQGSATRGLVYLGTFLSAAMYAILAFSTGEIHPARMVTTIRETEEKSRAEDKKYRELVDKLFGKNGLADRNGDGLYNFEELVDAFRRMGPRFSDRVYMADDSFPIRYVGFLSSHPQPIISELESAIQSYSKGN